jgi:YihY family inner membrane protein
VNPIERTVRSFDEFQQRHGPLAFLFGVVKKFGDDQAGNLAALLAYFAFFAIFPLLLLLVTILGIVLRSDPALQQRILHSALVDFPVIGVQLQHNVHSLNATGAGFGVGLAGSLWGARGIASAIQTACNTVWQVPKVDRPGFPWNQLRTFGVLFVLAVGLVLTGFLSGLGGGAGTTALALRVGALGLSAAVNVAMFFGAFRLATAKEVASRCLLPGAVTAGIAWQVLLAIGGYVVLHDLRHSSQVYGLFGLVLGLLSWLYLQAQITLYALEADVVRAKRLWPRSLVQPPLTVADENAYAGYVQTEARRPEQKVSIEFEPSASEAKTPTER